MKLVNDAVSAFADQNEQLIKAATPRPSHSSPEQSPPSNGEPAKIKRPHQLSLFLHLNYLIDLFSQFLLELHQLNQELQMLSNPD